LIHPDTRKPKSRDLIFWCIPKPMGDLERKGLPKTTKGERTETYVEFVISDRIGNIKGRYITNPFMYILLFFHIFIFSVEY
jgi:hypothetical protein